MFKGNPRRGATALTYGLVVGLVALAGLAAVTRIGESVDSLFGTTSSTMLSTVNSSDPTTPQPSPSPSPTREDVFFQCTGFSTYVVFAENTENLSINSFTSTRDACLAYGFQGLGTDKQQQNDGVGASQNSDLTEAISCHNCFWGDGGNAWYRSYGHTNSTGDDCRHVSGTAPAQAILGGGVLNAGANSIGCATFKQDVNSSTVFGDNDSSEAEEPWYHADHNNNLDEPNCTRTSTSNNAVSFTGVPDYVLCASLSAP